MTLLQPQVHRTILVVDIERFTDQRRTNQHQVVVREGLYDALKLAFHGAGIPWSGCHHEDRGDGILILAPAEVPKGPFVESLPHGLAKALGEYNRTHRTEQRIRLRMALHAGEIRFDDYGVTAVAINMAFRLVDAAPVKTALAGSPGVLALIVSSWFFDEVVRHAQASDQATYRPVRVAVKETNTVGWVSLPDHPYPPNDNAIVPLAPVSSHDTNRPTRWIKAAGLAAASLALGWALFTYLPAAEGHGHAVGPTAEPTTTSRTVVPQGDLTIRPYAGGFCELRAEPDSAWFVDVALAIVWTGGNAAVPASNLLVTTDTGISSKWYFSPAPIPPGYVALSQPGDRVDFSVESDDSYLSRLLRLTITIDPDNTVREVEKNNNRIVIAVDLRTTVPPSGTNKQVNCYQE